MIGLHRPITADQARPFDTWFNRVENGGFQPYDADDVLVILRDLLQHLHQIAFDMMKCKSSYSAEEYNDQASKAFTSKKVYDEIAGSAFVFEIPCVNDTVACNSRRQAERGNNHSHEATIDLPTRKNLASYQDAIRLKAECQELGITPSTGVVTSIDERVKLLKGKVNDQRQKMSELKAATSRLKNRPLVHRVEKTEIRQLSYEVSRSQCSEACETGNVTQLLSALKGAVGGLYDANRETSKGVSPLMCLLLNDADLDHFETLAKYKVNFNVQNAFHLCPLAVACRLLEVKLLHGLLRNGASPYTLDVNRRNAVHWCVLQSNEEGLKVLLSYVAESGGKVPNYLNAIDNKGETALFLAVRYRNGLMCKVLCSLGVDSSKKNFEGKSASVIARDMGWYGIADWLEKRLGGGNLTLESPQDVHFERLVRYGSIKLRELLQSFLQHYSLWSNIPTNSSWLLSAAQCRSEAARRKETVLREQMQFVNTLCRRFSTEESDFNMSARTAMLDILEVVLEECKVGKCCPNTSVAFHQLIWTPLLCAVAMNDVRMVRLLLKEGACLEGSNVRGTTALMLAAWLDLVDMVIELLLLGADANTRDLDGYNASMYAGLLAPSDLVSHDMQTFIIQGDECDVKAYRANDVFKLLASFTCAQVAEKLSENKKSLIKQHNERQIREKLLARIGLDSKGKEYDLNLDLHALHAREKAALMKTCATPPLDSLAEDKPLPRCFLCTIPLPCSHFMSHEAMLRRLNSVNNPPASSSSSTMSSLIPSPGLPPNISTYALEQSNLASSSRTSHAAILNAFKLHDRGTDRNYTLIKTYRKGLTSQSVPPLSHKYRLQPLNIPEVVPRDPTDILNKIMDMAKASSRKTAEVIMNLSSNAFDAEDEVATVINEKSGTTITVLDSSVTLGPTSLQSIETVFLFANDQDKLNKKFTIRAIKKGLLPRSALKLKSTDIVRGPKQKQKVSFS